MMKILIAYAGKSGTCARAAHELKALLPQFDVTVADLTENTPPPMGYGLWFSGVPCASENFTAQHEDTQKNTGTCCKTRRIPFFCVAPIRTFWKAMPGAASLPECRRVQRTFYILAES